MTTPQRTFGIDLACIPADQATIPFTDLIVRRAYGAFDFLRVVDGVPLFIDDHLARFDRSAELLDLHPRPTHEALKKHVADVIDANGPGNYGMQLFLTGGDPTDNFTPTTPRTLVLVDDLAPYPEADYQNGVSLLTHAFTRDLPEAKTTNYFTAVRHARTLREAGAADLLYHDGSHVFETTRCNLFIADRKGALHTAAEGMLPGITRLHVLEALEGDTPVEVGPVAMDALWDAPEVFITSTTKGVMPVVRIDDHVVGDGEPGPLTRHAMERFERHREAWLTQHATTWRG